MLVRADVEGVLGERATVAHSATMLAPYSFEVRPTGFRRGEPHYRVVIDRVAFALRATVFPDYLAVAIVAAVSSGASNNPPRLHRLESALRDEGWEPNIELGPEGFRIQAVRRDLVGLDDQDLAVTGAIAALLLSEFVLDQLIVTRAFGEVRPAVERSVGDSAETEPWLYDPSERDRSTKVHRALENWLMQKVREAGLDPLDPAGEPFFDLAWRTSAGFVVVEVKSTRSSEDHQIRLGLGQILQYRSMLEKAGADKVIPAVLVESEPSSSLWLDTCQRAGVLLFWPGRWEEIAPMVCGGD